MRKSGSFPRLCWLLAELSVGLSTLAPAVSDRSARFVAPCGAPPMASAPLRLKMRALPFPSDVPPGCPKGCSRAHHCVVRTREGVPTNWAGTPRWRVFRPSRSFCQGAFEELLGVFPVKNAPIPLNSSPWHGTGRIVRFGLSTIVERENEKARSSRTGLQSETKSLRPSAQTASQHPPSPPGPWSRTPPPG